MIGIYKCYCLLWSASTTRETLSFVESMHRMKKDGWALQQLVGTVMRCGCKVPKDWRRQYDRRYCRGSEVAGLNGLQARQSSANDCSARGAGVASSWSRLWEAMGSPKYVAAPMVAQSDYAFRQLCRRYGVDLAYTQMIHARNFVACRTFQKNHLDVFPLYSLSPPLPQQAVQQSPPPFENGPLIVQIAGNDPSTMLQASQIILDQTRITTNAANRNNNNCNGTQYSIQAIDINFGCPQSIAKKGNYGAFLLRNIDLTCRIISTLRNNIPSNIGITAKMRIPDKAYHATKRHQQPPQSQEQYEEELLKQTITQMIHAGIDLLTIHGRTLKENKTNVSNAHWEKIRLAVETVQNLQHIEDDEVEFGGKVKTRKKCIPIIANGGIEYPSDIAKCLNITGANAIMSSEALLENPGLFAYNAKDECDMSFRQILNRQFQYAVEYLNLAMVYPPTSGSTRYGSHNVVKGHLFKMLYRYLAENEDLRDQLACAKTTYCIEQSSRIVYELKGRYDGMTDDDLAMKQSSNLDSSWYRRHRRKGRISQGGGNEQYTPSWVGTNDYSIDERKRIIRQRISKLKLQKQEVKPPRRVTPSLVM